MAAVCTAAVANFPEVILESTILLEETELSESFTSVIAELARATVSILPSITWAAPTESLANFAWVI